MSSVDATSHLSEKPSSSTYVVLPCSQDNFRDFVAGLLGKPQESKGSIEGVFRIGQNEISNIFHLIDQRVKKQNDASLIHFSISVHYSDGSSITHNTVSAFQHHHQTANSHSIAITVSFNYLVKFNDRDIPEKQEIDVTISTDPEQGPTRGDFWFHSGIFSYRIRHTEITWATDVAGLLKNHAESIMDRSSKLKVYLANHSEELMGHWFTLIFLGVVALWTNSAIHIQENNLITTVPGALRYFSVSLSIFLGLAAVLFSIRSFFDRNFFVRSPSFIVLDKKDEEHAENVGRKLSRRWVIHVAGWTIGLASGVFSNFLYALLRS